jgi:hypothetical protein
LKAAPAQAEAGPKTKVKPTRAPPPPREQSFFNGTPMIMRPER